MKRLLALLMFVSTPALASPHVVTDPVAPGVTHCGVFLDSTAKVTIAVTAVTGGNICKYNVAGVSAGAHTIRMTAIINDPLWGTQESPQSAPLAFTKPGVPPTPAGLNLTP